MLAITAKTATRACEEVVFARKSLICPPGEDGGCFSGQALNSKHYKSGCLRLPGGNAFGAHRDAATKGLRRCAPV